MTKLFLIVEKKCQNAVPEHSGRKTHWSQFKCIAVLSIQQIRTFLIILHCGSSLIDTPAETQDVFNKTTCQAHSVPVSNYHCPLLVLTPSSLPMQLSTVV